MKNVLVIGSTGQIGSELTMQLRKIYHQGRIVAGYIPGSAPTGDLLESGPAEQANVCNGQQIAEIVDKYDIDTIYNLAALLSATAERLPLKAWDIQMNGLINILEVAREKHCAVFTPSSIGSFGPDTHKYGVDTRSVRFPGLISYKTLPGGGTTDYAVEIYYAAVKGEEFVCPLAHGTYLDMMYMPDAIKAAIKLMEADPRYLVHRNAFNIASMSFDPEGVYEAIRKHIPTFKMRYEVDPVRQAIADSWPNKMDDVCARKEWGWTPSYNLDSMTRDMIKHLREKLL